LVKNWRSLYQRKKGDKTGKWHIKKSGSLTTDAPSFLVPTIGGIFSSISTGYSLNFGISALNTLRT
jgi:hypothetical protein